MAQINLDDLFAKIDATKAAAAKEREKQLAAESKRGVKPEADDEISRARAALEEEARRDDEKLREVSRISEREQSERDKAAQAKEAERQRLEDAGQAAAEKAKADFVKANEAAAVERTRRRRNKQARAAATQQIIREQAQKLVEERTGAKPDTASEQADKVPEDDVILDIDLDIEPDDSEAQKAAEEAEKRAAERAAAEKAAREAAEKAEREKAAREAAERVEAERIARETAERAAAEKAAREAAERAEAARIAREAAEKATAEEARRKAAEEAARAAEKEDDDDDALVIIDAEPAEDAIQLTSSGHATFVADNKNQFKPAVRGLESFEAIVYLAHAYSKRDHHASFAYFLAAKGDNGIQKKRIVVEDGYSDDEYEYAFLGALLMFQDIVKNGIRQVLVYTQDELSRAILMENAMNVRDNFSETRSSYAKFMRRNGGIEFSAQFAVQNAKMVRSHKAKMDTCIGLAKQILTV